MTNAKQKLELSWIGKEKRPQVEPRILQADDELSYHAPERHGPNDRFDNILIQGDNLLALKALEAEFVGAIKCIYIDPPFNTGQAFDHYDDGLEHSTWLSLLRDRLELLSELLADDGTIFVHIDDSEAAYLIILMDEIFGRKNRINIVTFKQGSATGHKAINPGCVTTHNFVLIYAKNKDAWEPNRVFTARDRDARYGQFIVNRDSPTTEWKIVPLAEGYAQHEGLPLKDARKRLKDDPGLLDAFVMSHPTSVVQLARPDYDAVGKETKALIDESEKHAERIYHQKREGYEDIYLIGGRRILFYSSKLREIDGRMVTGEPLTTIWDDLLSNNLHAEGGVEFAKSKKPEALIQRVLALTTDPGDVVLDSFAGSGTTGAVAHKMGRRWIMVEQGAHATTHIVPRLKGVISGEDVGGVTEATGWKGGGGFRFYRLAPSLLEKDQFDNWVISKKYDAAMLAEAMCKHMGFTYAPSTQHYWMQGYSSERDFIYTTTQSLPHDQLRALSEAVGPDRSLLVCCKAFQGKHVAEFKNLTVKKIPLAILHRCEWGKDDYSVSVAALAPPEPPPQAVEANDDDAEPEEPPRPRRKRKKKAESTNTLTLDFDGEDA